jgi:FecR protein
VSLLDDERPDGDWEPADLSPRAVALTDLARKSLGQISPVERARGRDTLRARLAFGRWRTGRPFTYVLLGAAAATAVVALVSRAGVHEEAPAPLAYGIEGGALGPGGVIEARGATEPAVRFADGTVITLAKGTQGRINSVDGRGAHLSIAEGTASVNVVPRPHARWRIDAGPFTINVHGTVFTAAWSPATGRLDVRMERGLISVEGPLTGGPLALRAGQRLTVVPRESRVILARLDDSDDDAAPANPIAPAAPSAAAPSAPTERPAAPVAVPVAVSPARPAVRPARPGRTWGASLAAGDFASIVDDAERDLPRALASASSDDLAALADAARYRRRDDLARRALSVQRRRFAESPRAADAAFFLGRLDENDGGGLIHALRWYDRYLDEAPSGSYAAEALGRKMIALRELYGAARARDVADEYVRRFPRGSYAGAARALRGER